MVLAIFLDFNEDPNDLAVNKENPFWKNEDLEELQVGL